MTRGHNNLPTTNINKNLTIKAKSKNMSPEDRAAYNAQKAKMKAKLDKAEADLRKVQGEYNGLV